MRERLRDPKIRFVVVLFLGSLLIVLSSVFLKKFYLKATPSNYGQESKGEIKISCPVPKEYCRQGKIIDNGNDFYGISYTLPPETPLLAGFNGTLSDQPKIPGRPNNQPLLYLRNDHSIEITYSFFGTALESKTYTQNEPIGTIGQGQFPPIVPFAGSNLLISVKKDSKAIKFLIE